MFCTCQYCIVPSVNLRVVPQNIRLMITPEKRFAVAYATDYDYAALVWSHARCEMAKWPRERGTSYPLATTAGTWYKLGHFVLVRRPVLVSTLSADVERATAGGDSAKVVPLNRDWWLRFPARSHVKHIQAPTVGAVRISRARIRVLQTASAS